MIYNYDELVAGSLPETVDMPPGLAEDVKYVFSVTYTDPYPMSKEVFSEALHWSKHSKSRTTKMRT